MAYSKTNIMHEWWIPIGKWIENNTLLFTCFALAWKAIDRAFKYMSDVQTAKLNKALDERIGTTVMPEIKRLHESIDELRESIWDLKK